MKTVHIAASAATLLLACQTAALAHITLEQREAKAGSGYKAVLRVPHGCGGSATTSIRVQIPEGLFSVKPMPKPGWTLTTLKGAYGKTYSEHGSRITEGVKEITWSGGKLPDDNYDEFILAGSLAPDLKDGTTLSFPTVQECEKGSAQWAPVLRVAATAMAQSTDYTIGKIKVSTPWVRATPKGAPVGGGYLKITNTGTEPDRLIGGTFPLSGKVELHEMSMDNGVMRMRQLPNGLEIAPGATVELKPAGYHIMFQQLKEPIVQGKPIHGTLVFEKAGTLTLDWAVSPIGASSAPAAAKSGMGDMDMGGMNMDGHAGHQH
ncbi:DUF1775 domain-containing protein [Roseiarcaceae bacterium H3SJ34-1]|uniref:DUF1775 domain-containing protein n=1 Tax=Terripilifer ovatus TaxID=3032367 RepID=UPI003AB93FFD|nr:DUF1775 domain-containing protein [Roseiarcaceae bacterium H3SJ34-1]